jgi:hypothetical protein
VHEYIILDGISIDGGGSRKAASLCGSDTRIRLQNGEIKNSSGTGLFGAGRSQIINMSIHDNAGYGMYTTKGDGVLITGNDIWP